MINYTSKKCELPQKIQQLLNKGNVFYSDEYADYLKSKNGTLIYLYSEQFVLLTVIQSKYIFKYAFLPVEYMSIENFPHYLASEFLDRCMDLLKKRFSIQWVNPTSASALFMAYPKNSIRIPFGSHVIDLKESEELIWEKIHGKTRNSIRRAEKCDVKILFGSEELLDQYLLLDQQTWKRSGRDGMEKITFYEMFRTFGKNILIGIAYKNNLPQGGAVFYYNPEMSYYMFGASKDQPEPGSINLLHWRTIIYMKKLNVKKYSLVGCRVNEDIESKYHTIQRFKERFGGDFKKGYMFKVVNNKKLYSLYKFLIKMKTGNNYSDAIDQEIHKWKEIN